MDQFEDDDIQQLAIGNPILINTLYKNIFPKLKAHIIKNKGTIEDAEDIFQKVLMQIITRYRVKPFVLHTSFEGFIFIAGMNLWRRELNKKKRLVTNSESLELTINDNDDIILAAFEHEKWEFFQEKLGQVSGKCKQLLQLFFKKVPYKDIVTRLNYKSDNVVRQRIFNCKSQLKKSIEQDPRFDQLKSI